jgi:dolichol-phosphate mannosyltransferase
LTPADWPPVSPAGVALTVVVPLYDEIDNLERIENELLPMVAGPSVEVILVDDGSGDGTAERARSIPGVRVISLARSGKSEALRSGIEAARGEWVLTIDGDLQEDPAEIPATWRERVGFDAVAGVRSRRCDPLFGKRIPSRLFNAAVRGFFGVALRDVNCGFRLVRREAYAAVDWFPGAHRFVPVALARAGFRVRQRAVRHRPRQAGRSKFARLGRALEALRGMARLSRSRPPRRSRAALAMALAAWAAVSIEAGLRARAMWPVHVGDEIAFMPPMLARAQGHGLVNEIRPVDRERDPSGKGRFVHHGFLGAMVVGSVAPPSYRGVEATLTALGIGALGLSAGLFWMLLGPFASGAALFLPAAGVLALSTPLFGFQGRPEPFAMLLLAGFSVVALASRRARLAVAGIAIGVLGCAHPIACLLAFFLAAAALFAKNPPAKAAKSLATLCAAAIGAAVPLFLWFPFDLAGWIRGNISHAEVAVLGGAKSSLAAGWLLYTQTFGAAPIFLLAGGWALAALVRALRGRREPFSRVFAAAAAAAFAAIAWFVGVRIAWRSYDVLLLSPVVLGWLVFEASRRTGRRGEPALVVAALFLAAFSGGFLRVSLVRWAIQDRAVSYDEARDRLSELDRASPSPVLVSNAAFTLIDDARGFRLLSRTDRIVAGQPLFLAQAFSGWDSPPALPGFTLVEDRFTRERPRWLGIPIARNVPGYNYAVYVAGSDGRIDPAESLAAARSPNR